MKRAALEHRLFGPFMMDSDREISSVGLYGNRPHQRASNLEVAKEPSIRSIVVILDGHRTKLWQGVQV